MKAKAIRQLMPNIIPHMILKKEQAELLMEAFQYILPRGTKIRHVANSDHTTESMFEIYRKLLVLNEKPFKKQEERTEAEKLLLVFRKRGLR